MTSLDDLTVLTWESGVPELTAVIDKTPESTARNKFLLIVVGLLTEIPLLLATLVE